MGPLQITAVDPLLEALHRNPEMCDISVTIEDGLSASEQSWDADLALVTGMVSGRMDSVGSDHNGLYGMMLGCRFLQVAIGRPFKRGEIELDDVIKAAKPRLAAQRFALLKVDPLTRSDFFVVTADATYCCLTCYAYCLPGDNRFSARTENEFTKVFKVCGD